MSSIKSSHMSPQSSLIEEIIGCRPTDSQGSDLVTIREFQQKGIIKNHTCQILTILVRGTNSQGLVPQKRHGWGTSEDNSYKYHNVLHRAVPRCYSFLRIVNTETQKVELEKRMHGFYKFSSNDPNNEDEDIACQLIDPQELKLADHVIVTEKANGKSGIITAFTFAGEVYLLGGSKNKHRVVRLHSIVEDITQSEKEENSQNTLITGIFTQFAHQFHMMSSEKKAELIKLLHTVSLCGEYNDYKHIVSNQKVTGQLKDNIEWFGFSHNLGTISQSVSLTGHFLNDIKTIQSLGLPTINLYVHTRDEFEKNYAWLKLCTNCEGFVIHWVQTLADGSQKTIGVEKLKTWWYIVIRMLREIIRGSAKTKNFSSLYEVKVNKTLLKRNQDFMKLPDGMLLLWSQLCCRFCEWFIQKGFDFNTIDFNENSLGMGNTWQLFLKECPDACDRFDLPEREVKKHGLESYVFQGNVEIKTNHKLVVFFKGIQGLGKSFIGQQVATELNNHGYPTLTLEQDDFKGKTAGKQCLMKFIDYLKKPNNRIVILQRNNANLDQYRNYLEEAQSQGCRILIVTPEEMGLKSLLLVCMEAVLNRQGHKTFDQLKPELRAKLVLSNATLFANDYVPQSDHEQIYSLKWLKVENDQHLPPDVIQYLDEYLSEITKSKNVFDNNMYRPMNELINRLYLINSKYAEWRRSREDIVAELLSVISAQVSN